MQKSYHDITMDHFGDREFTVNDFRVHVMDRSPEDLQQDLDALVAMGFLHVVCDNESNAGLCSYQVRKSGNHRTVFITAILLIILTVLAVMV